MNETSEATVKGLILRGALRWFNENHEASVFEQFVDALPQEDREDWKEGLFLATSQLPSSKYVNMYRGFQAVWGADGDAQFRKAAGAVAFYDLSSVMKVFMLLGTPGLVASRFPLIYNRYFSEGSYTLVPNAPGMTLTAELKDAASYGRAGCQGTLGWTRKALAFSGAKNLEVIHSECAANGGGLCKFEYRWD